MHGLPGRLFTTLQVSPRTANLHKTILILARSDHPIDPNATIRPTPVAISERFPYPFPTVHAKSSRKKLPKLLSAREMTNLRLNATIRAISLLYSLTTLSATARRGVLVAAVDKS